MRGLGGGGCLLGSVGLSEDELVLVGLRTGGGVAGLAGRRTGGGDGLGDGGRGRERGLGCGEAIFDCGFVRDRGTENERDLETIFNGNYIILALLYLLLYYVEYKYVTHFLSNLKLLLFITKNWGACSTISGY